jgi:Zn-dependent protease with chaperone function
MTTALALGTLAVILSWPVPLLLARARWTWQAPRAALILWQAIGLAASLAAIGAGLALAVAPLSSSLFEGLLRLGLQAIAGQPYAGLGAINFTGFAVATVIIAHLAGEFGLSLARTLRARARLRQLIDLLGEPHPAAHDASVLDHPAAVAYCLPGLRPRLVLSAGTVDMLSEPELAAVLAHERAHARLRHDLVVLPFLALRSTAPWVPVASRAHQAVAMLVEMHADDCACQRHEPEVLAAALARVGGSQVPAGALGVPGTSAVVARVHRLLEPERPPAWLPAAAYLLAAALLLIPTMLLAGQAGGPIT